MTRSPSARRWGVVVSAAIAALAIAACGSSSSSSAGSATGASVKITASNAANTSNKNLVFYEVNNGCASDPFWAAVNNGASAVANDLGVTVHIANPQNCESQAEENALLTSVVNTHPAGIAISVTSPTAFSANIQRARQMGIPVIAYNSIPPNNNTTQNPVQAFVGTDLFASGVDWANEAIKQFHLTSGAQVPIADVCVANIACETIVNGWNSVAKPAGISSPIINVPQAEAEATSTIHAYLEQHPNIKAILGLGAMDPVVAALQQSGKSPGQIPIAGYNFNGKMPQYMQQGWLAFTVDQGPYLQGWDAVQDLYMVAKYKQPPVNIQTGPDIINKSDTALIDPALVAKTGY
jgi:simple sugar transport system substrate-binding protein